jgi:GH18 family chitinase
MVKRFGAIDDSTVSKFRLWGDSNNVKIMLCVYNSTPSGWDWDLAKSAFSTHRKQFIETLVKETVRLELDGVDIDFEGKAKLNNDKEAFAQFIKDLSKALRVENKELTVDTFAYKWNAPNQSWWQDLLPLIDGLHVMGYSETGKGASDWRSYEFIKAAAGKHSSKLLIGMPGNATQWQEKSAKEHLQWVANEKSMGLAIWDAQLKEPKWRTKSIWQIITKIKKGDK